VYRWPQMTGNSQQAACFHSCLGPPLRIRPIHRNQGRSPILQNMNGLVSYFEEELQKSTTTCVQNISHLYKSTNSFRVQFEKAFLKFWPDCLFWQEWSQIVYIHVHALQGLHRITGTNHRMTADRLLWPQILAHPDLSSSLLAVTWSSEPLSLNC